MNFPIESQKAPRRWISVWDSEEEERAYKESMQIAAEDDPVTFVGTFSVAKKRRLQSLYNAAMHTAEERDKWDEMQAQTREQLNRDILQQLTNLLLVSLCGAVCATCRGPTRIEIPSHCETIDKFVADYVRRALASRPWTLSQKRTYYPSHIEIQQFIYSLIVTFFSADVRREYGAFCADSTCQGRAILLHPLPVSVSRDSAPLDKLQKEEEVENNVKNDHSSSNNNTALAATRKTISDAIAIATARLGDGASLSFGDPRCSWIEIKQHDINGIAGFSILFVRWSGNEAFLMPLLKAIDNVPLVALPSTDDGKRERRRRIGYRLQYQYDLQKDSLLSYDQVLERTRYYVDSLRFAEHQIHHFAHTIVLPFRFEMITQKTSEGVQPTILQILQYTHSKWVSGLDDAMKRRYEAEFEEQVRLQREKKTKSSNSLTNSAQPPTHLPNIALPSLQTSTHLSNPLPLPSGTRSNHIIKQIRLPSFDATGQSVVVVKKGGTTLTSEEQGRGGGRGARGGGGGGVEGERVANRIAKWDAAKNAGNALSICDAFEATAVAAQNNAYVAKYSGAIAKLVDWLHCNTLDSVRCADPVDAQGFPMPQLFYSLPFLFFLHAHCDLVANGLYAQSREQLYKKFAPMFDDFYADELSTLYAMMLPMHVDEQCARPRNLVGIVRTAKPYVVQLPLDVICAIDGFVEMHYREFPLLRQMLVGTRLRLVAPFHSSSSRAHTDVK